MLTRWAGDPAFLLVCFIFSRYGTSGGPSLRFVQEPALSGVEGVGRDADSIITAMPRGLHRILRRPAWIFHLEAAPIHSPSPDQLRPEHKLNSLLQPNWGVHIPSRGVL